MVHIKVSMKRVPEKACSEIFEDLLNYSKILRAKHGIRFKMIMGPFYSTIKEVKSSDV